MSTPQTPSFPPQHQNQQPGIESQMNPRPVSIRDNYRPSQKLENKVALISGGDSGIGRAVAYAFAREGANIAITYLNEHDDANETKRVIEEMGNRCFVFAGDIGTEQFCQQVIANTAKELGGLNILVNNAAEQHVQTSLQNISSEQLEKTFRTNIFSYFYLTKAALSYLKSGSTIINTTSITAYQGHEQLIDYASTKGAIVTFTRSMALSLVNQGIRVNGVAPGPIWTPLIPASFSEAHVAAFGQDTPMKRAGQPAEVASSYVFLASDDSSYMSGQILHPNGGTIVNG
ncbi:MAG: 3-oxoacyl-(acyl-carrier-protein) reductase [Firmicutes bacterium]|nr:3-oxoacyl-(acyl-carrier-protein) reductase [Bacillota bacterium]